MKNILINDLNARTRSKRELIDQALARVLDSGWLVLGAAVKDFETAFAEYLGATACVGLANGTDAIELGLRALNIQTGDVVATVANAGGYSTTALLAIGAQPFYMDVDENTHNVPLDEVDRAIRAGVKAVIVTHLYGRAVADIEKIADLCQSRGAVLFEDCAQAHGASVSGRRVGTFGQAAGFSFYPTKNLGALGDGGAVVTSDAAIATRVRELRQYGWTDKYHIAVSGARNSRLDELQAAVLRVFLDDLDVLNLRRRHIAAQYSRVLKNKHLLIPAVSIDDASYVAHLYVVRCLGGATQRVALQAHLRAALVGSDIHYPVPDHQQAVFGQRFASTHLPITERLCQEVITLPCYPEMQDAQIEQVVQAVNSWQP